MMDIQWMRVERDRLGLSLTDEDLEDIRIVVRATREDLSGARKGDAEALQGPYVLRLDLDQGAANRSDR